MYFSSKKDVKSLKKFFLKKEKLIGKYNSLVYYSLSYSLSRPPLSFSLSHPSLPAPSHATCVKLAVLRTLTRAYEYFLKQSQ